MDSDDLLAEILLRLPPQPPSLHRVSLVSKRWHRLVTDPRFLRRFFAHHREAPIIGVFLNSKLSELTFRSILDPPNLIPPERFSLRLDGIEGGREEDGNWSFRGCRHGRVLLIKANEPGDGCRQVLVWDPITGDRRRIRSPPHLNPHWNMSHVQGDVLCASSDRDHVHGDCHSSPFKVVLVSLYSVPASGIYVAGACVYSSETGLWGNIMSTEVQSNSVCAVGSLSLLVGSSLYWFLFGYQASILELDLDRQSLAVIEVPWYAIEDHCGLYLCKVRGALGFIAMSENYTAQLWERTIDLDGVARWMPGQTVDLYNLLLKSEEQIERVLGFAAASNVMFVSTTSSSVFMVHIETLQIKKVFLTEDRPILKKFPYPFASFCIGALGNNPLKVGRQGEGRVGSPTHYGEDSDVCIAKKRRK